MSKRYSNFKGHIGVVIVVLFSLSVDLSFVHVYTMGVKSIIPLRVLSLLELMLFSIKLCASV